VAAETDVEGAGAEVKIGCEILTEGERGMSTAVMMDGPQRHGRGADDVIRDLDHDHDQKAVNGGWTIIGSPEGEAIFEIGVAHRTDRASTDGAMTRMIGMSAGDDAHVELVHTGNKASSGIEASLGVRSLCASQILFSTIKVFPA
jgi:hypothetical protein